METIARLRELLVTDIDEFLARIDLSESLVDLVLAWDEVNYRGIRGGLVILVLRLTDGRFCYIMGHVRRQYQESDDAPIDVTFSHSLSYLVWHHIPVSNLKFLGLEQVRRPD